MKKHVSFLALLAFAAAGAFAQISLSAGGGFLFDLNLGNGSEITDNIIDLPSAIGGSVQLVKLTEKRGMNVTSIGLYGFFDATYVEVSAYFALGFPNNYVKQNNDDFSANYTSSIKGDLMLALGFSVLGKYPLLELGRLSLFPLLGISYNMILSHTDKDGGDYYENDANHSAGDLSQFGILAGAGADFDITRYVYIRGEALFHLRFPSNITNDNVGSMNDAKATFGIGPLFKLGIGFRL
jgi:hypothetical protein